MVLRMIGCCAAVLIGVASALPAQEYRPAFQPDTLKGPPAGRPNEVLVLGSTHLSGAPATLTPAMLAPLLDRLAAWRPTAVATEDLSGLQCDALRRYPARYAETVKDYCPDASLPLVLAARAVAVGAPLAALRPVLSLGRLAPVTLIWGGLRGGISVALALSLPDGPARSVALTATYVVVLFSVIVQGGTVERVLARTRRRAGEETQAA